MDEITTRWISFGSVTSAPVSSTITLVSPSVSLAAVCMVDASSVWISACVDASFVSLSAAVCPQPAKLATSIADALSIAINFFILFLIFFFLSFLFALPHYETEAISFIKSSMSSPRYSRYAFQWTLLDTAACGNAKNAGCLSRNSFLTSGSATMTS